MSQSTCESVRLQDDKLASQLKIKFLIWALVSLQNKFDVLLGNSVYFNTNPPGNQFLSKAILRKSSEIVPVKLFNLTHYWNWPTSLALLHLKNFTWPTSKLNYFWDGDIYDQDNCCMDKHHIDEKCNILNESSDLYEILDLSS